MLHAELASASICVSLPSQQGKQCVAVTLKGCGCPCIYVRCHKVHCQAVTRCCWMADQVWLPCLPCRDCGWFPTYSITEDFALGIELKGRGYGALYLKEYLAFGEAPEEIRSIFKQRSRWCKGMMQVR
jgi:cellulose synthase/poly-beta-1,6-N-acetylglucosamine synthase-like glycosyltransferase